LTLLFTAAGSASATADDPTPIRLATVEARKLERVWSIPCAAAADVVEVAGAPILLLHESRDDAVRVRLIETKSGRAIGDRAIELPAGARYVGVTQRGDSATSPRDRLLFFRDRFEIVAVALATGTIRWRIDIRPDEEELRSTDPEFFVTISDAVPTQRGLLVASEDGRVALLSDADGAPLWRLHLDHARRVSLHERDKRAAAVWADGKTLRVTEIDITSDEPVADTRSITDSEPIWSRLCDAGLVVVWSDRIRLLTDTGKWRRTDAAAFDHIRKSTVHLRRDGADDFLCFADSRGIHVVRSRDLRVGATFPFGTDKSRLAAPDALRIDGDTLILTESDRLWVVRLDATSGRPPHRFRVESADALSRTRVVPPHGLGFVTTAGPRSFVHFVDFTPDDENKITARVRTFGPFGSVSRAVAAGNLLMVVEDDSLRAYRLP
jgi:hypothetical protein